MKNNKLLNEHDTMEQSINTDVTTGSGHSNYFFIAYNAPGEYITFDEAAVLTGFKFEQIRDLGSKAGLTTIGNNAYFRSEFNEYWIYRNKEQKNRRRGETSKEFLNRINHEWRLHPN